jgi:hypothetical protein
VDRAREVLRGRLNEVGRRRVVPRRPDNISMWGPPQRMPLWGAELVVHGAQPSVPVLFTGNGWPPMEPGGRPEVLKLMGTPSRPVDFNDGDTEVKFTRPVTEDDIAEDYVQVTFRGARAKRAVTAALNLGDIDLAAVLPGGVKMPTSSNGAHLFLSPAKRPSMSSLHKDRGPAVLICRGKGSRKVVLLGPPCAVTEDNKAGDDVRVDPFVSGGLDVYHPPAPWRTVTVMEDEGVLIPEGWYHKVWSAKGTFALAIELQRRRSHRQKRNS